MNERIEEILRNPSVVKTARGDYSDDAAYMWAWFSHGYETDMQPFYSAQQLKEAVLAASPSASVNGVQTSLRNAAEQFVASCVDGDADELLWYYEEIFRLALEEGR